MVRRALQWLWPETTPRFSPIGYGPPEGNDLRNLVNGAPVLVPVVGNNYTVRFQTSGKCLDSAGNTTNDGAFSQLYSCHGNPNQRLSLVSAGNGVYNLKYKHSGKCIDVQNASNEWSARRTADLQ